MHVCFARIPPQVLPLVFLLLLCSACQPGEDIRTYTTERTSAPKPPFNTEEMAGQLDHTLAAMLPAGETVWFFKLAGPAEAVSRHRDEFTRFVSSVQKGESSDRPLSWELLNDWTEKGPSEMRLATIAIPDEKGEMEIAISSLPLSGQWDDFVALNVNRWLGQLSQGELAKPTILKQTSKVDTAAGPATVIELAGILKKSPAMNPHADMASGASQSSPPRPPVGNPAPTGDAGLSFKSPDGWQPGQTSSMRKAAFNIGGGEKRAEVTVIALPSAAGPQITDVQANVDRWAGQVGLPSGTNLEEFVEKIDIDGNSGSFVRLESPAETSPHVAMLVAMVEQGEKIWFFKMIGESELVDEQREPFRDFLGSVRFE
ncbi:hypothetical protein [Bythopirellula polymerisocia]|uniref:Uncharacterized protein n=1 Tax=Bythopirellula polymerisocia TaxID=2528003 RepID=A0A5C6CQX5_9BACT|nr:hypothetical protein [Bythopirellula polymerisocia]TWU27323.1 hypothetical protein Pla144_20950 [Bythopirellula polymerisocia]